jgi:hypothetical protein
MSFILIPSSFAFDAADSIRRWPPIYTQNPAIAQKLFAQTIEKPVHILYNDKRNMAACAARKE